MGRRNGLAFAVTQEAGMRPQPHPVFCLVKASRLPAVEQEHARRASAHWLRHTYATRAAERDAADERGEGRAVGHLIARVRLDAARIAELVPGDLALLAVEDLHDLELSARQVWPAVDERVGREAIEAAILDVLGEVQLVQLGVDRHRLVLEHAVRDLDDVFDRHWRGLMEDSPETATYVGWHEHHDRWTDWSIDAVDRRRRQVGEPLDALAGIDRSTDPLSAEVFESLVNPQRPIPPWITALTNISWSRVKRLTRPSATQR